MRFLGFFAVVLLAVVALADDKTFDSSFIAVVGNGTVYNSAIGTLKNEKFTIQTPSNLEGPVTVALSQTVTTKTIQICFSLVPIATTNNLESACAGYTFITLSNSTKSKDLEVKYARKSFSAFSSTKRLSSRFVNAAEVVEATPASATVQFRPSSQYYVVVASPDSSSSVLVTVLLNGDVCPEENQFGIGCPTINKPLVPGKATDFEADGGYTYFSAGTFAENVGSVTFTVAPAATAAAAAATFTLRAQLGALPSDSSYSANVTGSNTNTLTIPSPYAGGAQWYIGVLNSGEDVADAVITQVNTVCAANTFGYNCSQTVSNITNIAATNWTVWSVKANNNPTGYTYFKLTNTGALGVDASVVRVSVAPASGNVAPAVLAGYGYAPNPSNYEISTSGSYVNQVFLPINNQPADDAEQAAVFAADRWYIGVQSNQDFKIWAGANCANNCTGSKGTCTCDGLPCTFNTVYRLPSSTDSQGQCTCSSSSSDNNFDCSSKKSSESPLRTVYIVLIAVGGAIVLAVAIGVPVYCYLQNRKRGNYERV